MRNLRNSKGFTLIELMIVVVIIGILAAIAIPKFGNASRAAKQAEADPILKQVLTIQEAHRAQNGQYASTFGALVPFGWQHPAMKSFVATTDGTTITVKAGTPDTPEDPSTTTIEFKAGTPPEFCAAVAVKPEFLGSLQPRSINHEGALFYNATCS